MPLPLALLLLAPAADPGAWQPLFNGKDLTGWRANREPEAFRVADGAIRVQASSNVAAHLFHVGDKADGFEVYKNFELEAVARSEPNGNGGIFFHTDYAIRYPQFQLLASGYEVQLNSSEKEKKKTGSLYGIVDVAKSPVDETKWFTIRVTVVDKRITVAVDGQQVVDYTEPQDVKRAPDRAGRKIKPDGGAIALQAHDAKSVWYFREIRVKRLP